jgi:DNA-binding transcriptional regulator PaaX
LSLKDLKKRRAYNRNYYRTKEKYRLRDIERHKKLHKDSRQQWINVYHFVEIAMQKNIG